jgi:hypothetical protein
MVAYLDEWLIYEYGTEVAPIMPLFARSGIQLKCKASIYSL